MGIRVPGPQIIAFLEWLSQNAQEEVAIRSISKYNLWHYAEQFCASISIEDQRNSFNVDDVLHAIKYSPPRPWSLFLSGQSKYFSGDLLERYRQVPWHAILLFTSQDEEFRSYLAEHWDAWSDESADLLDFYDYSIRVQSPKSYSFTKDFVNALAPIPGATKNQIYGVGLPCMLIWSSTDYFLIPFSDISNTKKAIRDRFRYILNRLSLNQLDDLRYNFAPVVEDPVNDVSEVFLSYSHVDRNLVERLHDQLRKDGFSVWFDRHLHAGERFDLKIQKQIEAAKAAVVVWSSSSIKSQWVRSEALYAHTERKLLPVTFNSDLRIPPPFNSLHCEDLKEWFLDRNFDAYYKIKLRLDLMLNK